ncbi:hypothetical protein [Ruania zhangjianzhongii]|uniref:hypothetical protein n=1 Tax=Ruania zhangjianzhongii TaxID=2603206 RepID=UPI0011C9DE56|nr:hypothetical protein [Ruania zhangjianzhongii]
MPDPFDDAVAAAELALFARKEAALRAAAEQGLPGRFATFSLSGLRASMATAARYEFLNTIEGVTDQSVEALPAVLDRFANPHLPAIVTTFPSPALIDRLLAEGYAPAPVRPLAYLRPGTGVQPAPRPDDSWQIREVSTGETADFLDLLEAGYTASSEVAALIRAEHALPVVRGFIASRHDQPLAAAAMSVHTTAAVLGGAATLPAARGAGAQTALLAHRLRLVEALGRPVAAATAAPGTASVRNLDALGFTIVERSVWTCVRPAAVSTAPSTRRTSGSARRSG